jgi:hypothetical protein
MIKNEFKNLCLRLLNDCWMIPDFSAQFSKLPRTPEVPVSHSTPLAWYTSRDLNSTSFLSLNMPIDVEYDPRLTCTFRKHRQMLFYKQRIFQKTC